MEHRPDPPPTRPVEPGSDYPDEEVILACQERDYALGKRLLAGKENKLFRDDPVRAGLMMDLVRGADEIAKQWRLSRGRPRNPFYVSPLAKNIVRQRLAPPVP